MRVSVLFVSMTLAGAALSGPAFAAPCCGGSSVTPAMITGDDRAQISATVSQARLIGEAYQSGPAVFKADDDVDETQTLKLDAAYLITDRWQAGVSLPFVRRSYSTPDYNSASAGLGDASLNTAFEWLPEWEYSKWKPRGFAFAQTILPLGGSIYDIGLDARGRGFFALSAGAILLKNWGDWDASVLAEGHRSFDRTLTTQQGSIHLSPGWGSTAVVSGGYSMGSFRLGLALSPVYEQGIWVTSRYIQQLSDEQLVWNSSAQVTWLIRSDTSLNAIYTDQTLVGPATNVALNRTFALSFQKRWER